MDASYNEGPGLLRGLTTKQKQARRVFLAVRTQLAKRGAPSDQKGLAVKGSNASTEPQQHNPTGSISDRVPAVVQDEGRQPESPDKHALVTSLHGGPDQPSGKTDPAPRRSTNAAAVKKKVAKGYKPAGYTLSPRLKRALIKFGMQPSTFCDSYPNRTAIDDMYDFWDGQREAFTEMYPRRWPVSGLQKDMLEHVGMAGKITISMCQGQAKRVCEKYLFTQCSPPDHETALQLHTFHDVPIEELQDMTYTEAFELSVHLGRVEDLP
ncbi:hypothetical protein WJX73_006320 [Symbiochloris irregularis]|uniref:Uncharacterized protein n=1 Tax=Symbiochloris irregularis TaxID=706552 RepID=A0AAW1PML1_9CHLO